jgi:hypothetical protein
MRPRERHEREAREGVTSRSVPSIRDFLELSCEMEGVLHELL